MSITAYIVASVLLAVTSYTLGLLQRRSPRPASVLPRPVGAVSDTFANAFNRGDRIRRSRDVRAQGGVA